MSNEIDTYRSVAFSLHMKKQYQEAILFYYIILSLDPSDATIYASFSDVLSNIDQNEHSLTICHRGLVIQPGHIGGIVNAGRALHRLGKNEEALTYWLKAIFVDPQCHNAYINMAIVFSGHRNTEGYRLFAHRAAVIMPDNDDYRISLGKAEYDSGLLDEAEFSWRVGVLLRPDVILAYNNLGSVQRVLGHLEDAKKTFTSAVSIDPDASWTRASAALVLLGLGEYEEGWKEYALRWKTPELGPDVRDFSVPHWQGEPGNGRTLLIFVEQGFGDAFQFCRYVPMAAALGWQIILEAPIELVQLMTSLDGVWVIAQHGVKLPHFDAYCPMLNLPMIFKTTIDNIPSIPSYLQADRVEADIWGQRIAADYGNTVKIGLSWQGNPRSYNPQYMASNNRRSVSLPLLEPLFDLEGITFFSLQKTGGGVQAIANYPIIDFMDEINDFAGTAALIANLDLVISVDSAVVHLAGALGKPVWMLDRFAHCWRWERNCETTRWYPSMQIFRQKIFGQWPDVIERVCIALMEKFSLRNKTELAMLRKVVIIPDAPDYYYRLGQAWKGAEKEEKKERCYRQAIILRQDFMECRNLLASILEISGRKDEAVDLYIKSYLVSPNHGGVYTSLARLLLERDQLDPAAYFIGRAMLVIPDHDNFVLHHEIAIGKQKKMQDNLDKIREGCRGIALEPHNSVRYAELVVILEQQKMIEEAVRLFLRVVVIEPLISDRHSDLAFRQCQMLWLEEAALSWQKSLILNPTSLIAQHNLGYILRSLMRLDEAARVFLMALANAPDYGPSHANYALVLLGQGKFEEGWKEYEWRWHADDMKPFYRKYPVPEWRGEDGNGRTLFIYAEQGFGDVLQICRYVPLAANRGWKILLEVHPELMRLLGNLPGVWQLQVPGATLPHFDAYCPMLSLPGVFNTNLENIPSAPAYLFAEKDRVESWRRRLVIEHGITPRVGLLWAGNPRPGLSDKDFMDRRRSIPLKMLSSLFDRSEVKFFSLQKDAHFANETSGTPVISLMRDVRDFADTAGLVANLDLVIAVDSAVLHLAAALGKPVWMLDRFAPCWRWLPDRDDSPWYPTLRIFRQTKMGDWESVIARARTALMEYDFHIGAA